MQPSGFSSAKSYLLSFLRFAGKKAWISSVLMVMLGLTEGVGLLMLIPFLQLLGLGGAEKPGEIFFLLKDIFDITGLTLSLPIILCACVFIVGVHAVVGRYQEVLNARLILGYTKFMQDRLYAAFARVEWLCFTRISGADVVRVVTNDLPRVGFATRQLLELFATFVLTVIYICVALSVSWVMTLFALTCTVLIFLLLQPYNKQAYTLGEAFQTTLEDMYSVASEHVGGMKLARSYGLEYDYARNFFVITDKTSGQGAHFIQVNATTKMYHQIGAMVAVSAFFYIAAKFVAVPTTNLLLLVFVFARLAPKVSTIQHYIQHIANSLPAYHASSRMLKQLEEAAESPRPSFLQHFRLKNAIRINRVSFSYTDSQQLWALRGIDLVIPAEYTVAIVGPSGSGKTTLVDLIMGLLYPTEGTIFIDEEPLAGELVHNWRNSIGCVHQETFLFHDTIRNNLLWSRPDATEKDLWEAIRLAAAEAFVSALPECLDTVVGDRGMRLSGGERQRIALARALLRKPTLLVLDEATSNLDTENERHIQDAIEGLHGELTMVVIAQHLSTIRKADNIVVLEEGRVLETGTWEALLQKKDGRFRTILQQQC